MTKAAALGLLVFAFATVRTAAAEEAPLPRLFPLQADVIGTGGAVVLELPDDVVAACRPDLADLRLFDVSDNEIPFRFDAGEALDAPPSLPQVIAAKPIELDRREIGREHGPDLRREIYQIAVPDEAAQSGTWELHLDSPHAAFVRAIRVEAVEGGESMLLVDGESVFRLPDSQGSKTSVTLPALPLKRLRVTLAGQEAFFLEPRFSFRSERQVDRRAPIIVPLATDSTDTHGGRVVVTATRPSGIVPARIRIDSTTAWFDRQVEVWDIRQGFADRLVGRARVKRHADTKEPDDREVKVEGAQGQQLRIAIEGGDSPPLEELRIVAVAARPRLVFVAPAADAAGRVATLRFGGGRVAPPRYDIGKAGALAGADGAAPAPVALRNTRPNTTFEAAPSLRFAMRAGNVVDERLFTHRRVLAVRPSAEGLSRLRLRPEDLAQARSDLADVRVVDDQSRQWPYLINPRAATEEMTLPVTGVVHERDGSRYVFTPPIAAVRLEEIRLDTGAPFIDRGFALAATGADGESRPIAAGKLSRRVGDYAPPAIRFTAQPIAALELKITNGDDAPIEIRSGLSAVELPEIFLVAPAGEYALLLGYPDAEPPQYEIAQARDAILRAPAADVSPGDLRSNERFSTRARYSGGAALRTMPQVALWAALLVAVVVLGIVTARIARAAANSQ